VLKPDAKVLDVGSGSGYLCACFSKMMGDAGTVIGIDVIKPLVDWSINNLKKSHGDLLDKGVVQLKVGDGWKGEIKNAPFNAIHVGAAAEEVPKALTDQLAVGGRLLIPVDKENSSGQLYLQIDKSQNGTLKQTALMSVKYVRLIHLKDIKEETEEKTVSTFSKRPSSTSPGTCSPSTPTPASPTSSAPSDAKELESKPLGQYTIDDVCTMINAIGLVALAPAFRENAVDGQMMLTLTDDDYKTHLKFQPGQLRKLHLHLEKVPM